ncbi:unnamed protein product [Amoebophrya sp. A25]|nr:unnamed protein product [Amoebophrya sp. A25]|eukprot:GSA25T00024689001.1
MNRVIGTPGPRPGGGGERANQPRQSARRRCSEVFLRLRAFPAMNLKTAAGILILVIWLPWVSHFFVPHLSTKLNKWLHNVGHWRESHEAASGIKANGKSAGREALSRDLTTTKSNSYPGNAKTKTDAPQELHGLAVDAKGDVSTEVTITADGQIAASSATGPPASVSPEVVGSRNYRPGSDSSNEHIKGNNGHPQEQTTGASLSPEDEELNLSSAKGAFLYEIDAPSTIISNGMKNDKQLRDPKSKKHSTSARAKRDKFLIPDSWMDVGTSTSTSVDEGLEDSEQVQVVPGLVKLHDPKGHAKGMKGASRNAALTYP